uniref:Somatostatin/Cortistatin C-terminal domain-containing protein n=1 Tax=Crocodylus porosus TaxID=8502 RepID=A0A7M4E8K0_CROPO
MQWGGQQGSPLALQHPLSPSFFFKQVLGAQAGGAAIAGLREGQDGPGLDQTDAQRSSLPTFLSALSDWMSQVNEAPLAEAAVELAKRQERDALHPSPAREKSPCRNFFWKTFSSC